MTAWSREAAIEALQVVESEPEYPDAEACWPNVKQDLIDNGVSRPELVFDMMVQIARATVVTTKRCIAERLRAVTGVASDAKPTLADWVIASEGSALGRCSVSTREPVFDDGRKLTLEQVWLCWRHNQHGRPTISACLIAHDGGPWQGDEVYVIGRGVAGSPKTPAELRTILDTIAREVKP